MKKITPPSKIKFTFQLFAEKIAHLVGSPLAFVLVCLFIITWAFFGPIFHFSEKWQLFINSSTTIITLLMVFVIQNTQNRETASMHLKLDELLIKAGVKNFLIDIEDLSEEEREELKEEFKKICMKYSKKKKRS